jgi:hypothetical protein
MRKALALPGLRHAAWFWKTFPALSLALTSAFALSLLCAIVERIVYWDSRPKVFLLGDSGFCNYRLAEGEKLEDQMSTMLADKCVLNFAKPGARPIDLALQYTRGKAVAGKPDRVIALLSPELLLAVPNRMDGDGEDLRYLPLDADGLAIFRHISPREKNIAVVQRVSQFFLAPTDAAHELWLRWWKWPRKRIELIRSGPKRKVKIAEHCARRGEIMDATKMPTASEYDTLQTMRDVGLLLDRIAISGAKPEVVILPFGNPDLIATNWSTVAQGKRDTSIARLRNWLDRRQISYLDFNEAEWTTAFPGAEWDDMDHLHSPKSYGLIARRIAEHSADR